MTKAELTAAAKDTRIAALEADLARISEEMGLPPTIGPAPGALRRLLDDGKHAVARLEEAEAAIKAAVLAEREACAEKCMQRGDSLGGAVAYQCARDIRARTEPGSAN